MSLHSSRAGLSLSSKGLPRLLVHCRFKMSPRTDKRQRDVQYLLSSKCYSRQPYSSLSPSEGKRGRIKMQRRKNIRAARVQYFLPCCRHSAIAEGLPPLTRAVSNLYGVHSSESISTRTASCISSKTGTQMIRDCTERDQTMRVSTRHVDIWASSFFSPSAPPDLPQLSWQNQADCQQSTHPDSVPRLMGPSP
jgi:hypothetical protein